MISYNVIYQLVDYVLLNACSVNSTGLYNGKAGLSLCLFEMSRCLGDVYLEEQALNLLQEALVNRNQDISFENGSSGVGYVLIYLIRHKFIEADFYELFEEHLEKIIEQLALLEELHFREKTFHYIKVVYLLREMNLTCTNGRFMHYINFFLAESSLLLKERFLMVKNKSSNYSKMDLLGSVESYLSLLANCECIAPSLDLLELYAELYEKDLLISSYIVGYHLGNIAYALKNSRLEKLAVRNKRISLQNMHVDTMTLSQQIDMLWLLQKERNKYAGFINTLEVDLMQENGMRYFERKILRKIGDIDFIAGYESGIARFLLYWAYSSSCRIINQSFL